MKKIILLIIACLLSVSGLFAKTTKISEKENVVVYEVTDSNDKNPVTAVSIVNDNDSARIIWSIEFGTNYADHMIGASFTNTKQFERLAIENGNCCVIRKDCAVLFIYNGGYGCEVFGWNF